jgi:hypothetical protein
MKRGGSYTEGKQGLSCGGSECIKEAIVKRLEEWLK